MKGEARLIMGATLVMAVSLVLVLGLVIVLLAELYCSLLQRRRHRHCQFTTSSNTCASAGEVITTTGSPLHQSQPQSPTAPSLSSFYAQGVLRAPRNILFPAVSDKTDSFDVEQQHSTPLPFKSQSQSQSQSQSRRHGLFTSSPSPMFTPLASPKHVEKDHFQEVGADFGAHLVYISNPMYDNEGGRPSREDNTPFETPDSSPSRLETGDYSGDSSGEDDKEKLSLTSSPSSVPVTPPLTPMEKLPAEACSVSLRDARSLGTSDSDSNRNNDASSSTSGTPCTSPSW